MQLTDSYPGPTAYGACLICRAAQREGNRTDGEPGLERVLVLERSEEWLGDFAICETCCGEIAELFGFLSPKAALRLKAQLGIWQTEVRDLSTRVIELEEALTVANRREGGEVFLTPDGERHASERAAKEAMKDRYTRKRNKTKEPTPA
ncbi:MAG: hypothetical protein GY795_11430 [Desulfobacterales bacterium]|nr:hypothetical protein [Desulfobacterales bacterium]